MEGVNIGVAVLGIGAALTGLFIYASIKARQRPKKSRTELKHFGDDGDED